MSEPTNKEIYDHFNRVVFPYVQAGTMIARYLADVALHKHPNPLNAHGAERTSSAYTKMDWPPFARTIAT
jgi:hypothetical protein